MNKDMKYYEALQYRINIIPDTEEGGFTVSYPELPGCFSCGDTIEEALSNSVDAKREWFAACMEEGLHIPEPAAEEYSGQFRIRVPKSLHRRISENAKAEGVSMNSYCTFILARYA